MSFASPAYQILRKPILGEEAEWAKMFDPPSIDALNTPELVTPTNPVPNLLGGLNNTLEFQLLRNATVPMWDGKNVEFFLIRDRITSQESFPGPTLRVPRGVIAHLDVQTSGGPHTIHWHGIEPTPMNDGVGHCSFEIGGSYIYQWQPNFIGSYFYHCHRNTMQHFEFGLYGFLIVEPPDAYALPATRFTYPRRTAANLTNFPQFPGFTGGALTSLDPHAMTVPYDTEALWVIDDRDSRWSDFMSDHAAAFPAHGTNPGVNDNFVKGDFHDFNPDYFFVTGLPFPAAVGGTIACASNFTVPPALNCGVTGMQVPINAARDSTVLVRCLNAAYVTVNVTFPVDIVVIAYDGRALGVPPFGLYNYPYLVKAGTPLQLSTAQRFDALIRSSSSLTSFATVDYHNNRGGQRLFTGQIPITIT